MTSATEPPPEKPFENPFPGIPSYSFHQQDVFFGRDDEEGALLELVMMYRGVLLYSVSGLGKSSLVNAGLIPLAVAQGYSPERFRVQPKPDAEIVVERIARPELLQSLLLPDERKDEVVLSASDLLGWLQSDVARDHRMLLIFDQFEEWSTLFDEAAGEDALRAQQSIKEMIVSLIDSSELKVKVLLVFREEYLAKFEPLFDLCPYLPDQYLRLDSLDHDRIVEVIRAPFEKYPNRYVPALSGKLAKKIVGDLDTERDGGSIPLTQVQIVCEDVYREAHLGEKDPDDYFTDEAGRAKGILKRYLERSLESLDEGERQPAIGVLSSLVTSQGTRNVVAEETLISLVAREGAYSRGIVRSTLGHLVDNAQIVRRTPRRNVFYCEIVSEFLVEDIGKLTEEWRNAVATREADEEHAKELAAEQKKRFKEAKQALVAVGLLAVVAVVLAVRSVQAGSEEREQRQLAEQSEARALQAARLETQQRLRADSARRDADLAAESARAARREEAAQRLVAEAEEARADYEAKQAARQANLARSNELVVHARAGLEANPLLAVLLGGEALEILFDSDTAISQQVSPQLMRLLGDANSESRLLDTVVVGPVDMPLGPNSLATLGDTVAAAVSDVLRLGVARGSQRDSITGSIVDSLSPSTNVSYDAVGNLVTLANVTSRHPELGEQTGLSAVATGDSLVAIGSTSGVLTVAGIDTGVVRLTGLSDTVLAIDFMDTLGVIRVVGASRLGEVAVWDLGDPAEPVTRFADTTAGVLDVAFGDRGRLLATAGRDSTAKLWDSWSGNRLLTLRGHTDVVRAVTFSPQDDAIATAGDDGTVRIWSTSTGEEVTTLRGNTGAVSDVTYLTSGQHLVSVGTEPFGVDGDSLCAVVRLWDVAIRAPLFADSIADAALVEDSTLVEMVTNQARVRGWRALTPSERATYLSRDPSGAGDRVADRAECERSATLR